MFSRWRRAGHLAAVAGLAGVATLAGCATQGPAPSPPGRSGPAGSNNYRENRAAPAVLFDDARHAVLTGNEIAGDIDQAFALQNKATDTVINANLVRSARYEVGMDRSCRPGYQGPEPGGPP